MVNVKCGSNFNDDSTLHQICMNWKVKAPEGCRRPCNDKTSINIRKNSITLYCLFIAFMTLVPQLISVLENVPFSWQEITNEDQTFLEHAFIFISVSSLSSSFPTFVLFCNRLTFKGCHSFVSCFSTFPKKRMFTNQVVYTGEVRAVLDTRNSLLCISYSYWGRHEW